MRLKYKITALFTVMAMCISSLLYVHANPSGTTFEYTGITSPSSVYHNVNNSYRHNESSGSKAVHYYGYTRSLNTFTDDVFEDGYNYMCYGTGRTTTEYSWNQLTFNFPNNFTDMKAGDVLYFSFYYRSHSEFTGLADNNTYTGTATLPTLRFKDKNTAVYELASGKASGNAQNCKFFQPDDKWHKAEFYVPVTESIASLTTLSFWVCYMRMSEACFINMSGFSLGLLSLDESITPSNDAYYTLLGHAVNKASLNALMVNSENVNLSEGVFEYITDSDGVDPVIEAIGMNMAMAPTVEKIDNFNYDITAFAYGYDSIVDEEMSYSEKVADDGSFSETGTVRQYTVSNADKKSVYKLTLNIKPVTAVVKAGDTETNSLDHCVDGDVVTITETYNNFYDKPFTYITLLVIKSNGKIVRFVPFKTELAALQTSKVENFTYTLDLGDYTSAECDLLIIDTLTFGDILK